MPTIGQVPENWRQAIVKFVWIGIWGLYIRAPFTDLLSGRHGTVATVLGSAGLAAFLITYLAVVFFRTKQAEPVPWVYGALAGMGALALILAASLGGRWLVLFVYVTVACGAALPFRMSVWAIPAVAALLAAVGYLVDHKREFVPALLVPAVMAGFSLVGFKNMIRTVQELRDARETVAQLAATQERLRLARDLHDLLGHSLSLITLKSELAGRMLPGRPEEAAAQVADVERVSRQALVDVREAVTGYRRPTLAVELAAARGALRTAGIEPHTDAAPTTDVPADAEGTLAWALREAVTNVVRHSGATRCEVALAHTVDGMLRLTVTDNGRGRSPGAGPGNGLTGLEERLALAGGGLDTSSTVGAGFILRAHVPVPDQKSPATPATTRQ
jgi:two-component system, NarL family, sensor histidine kinase DesK